MRPRFRLGRAAFSAISALKLGLNRSCGVGTHLALGCARSWRLPGGSALGSAGRCLNAEHAEDAEGRRDTCFFTER